MRWLRDLFAGQTVKRDASCSFCGRSHVDAGPFVEGPAEVYICSACCANVSSAPPRNNAPKTMLFLPEEFV